MKYQHFLPPGTSFCYTYTERLTFFISGGHFYYTYTEISTFSPSRNVFLLYVYWNINILTLQTWLWPHPGTPQKYSRSSRSWKSNFLSENTTIKEIKKSKLVLDFWSSSWRDAPAGLPEVNFTTRILKYQHFHPPRTYVYSTHTEILAFLLSGGYFYYTYNEIS